MSEDLRSRTAPYTEPRGHGPRGNYRITFVVLTVGVAAYAMMQSMVIPVMHELQDTLHTTQNNITWVLTAYLLSASIFTPIMGRIGDMIGKAKVTVITLLALSLGCLLCALATNIGFMIVARVVQGIGGGVLPLAFGIIRDEFPKNKVAGAVGSIAGLTAFGGGAGIVLSGPIHDGLGSRWLFWLPMIVTALAAVAARFFVPESPVLSRQRISVLPAFLLSAMLVALLVAVSEAPTWGWGSPTVLGLFGAAIVLGVGWVASEIRAATPLIDMKMMRIRAVWTSNVVALLIGVGMYTLFAFIPEFVQMPENTGYGFGASITMSALIMLPSTMASFLISLLTGPAVRRVGAKWVVLFGCAISAVGMAMLAVMHADELQMIISSIVASFGISLTYAAMSGIIVAAVPPEQTGVASGMNANIRTIGGSIGAAVFSSIVVSSTRPDGLPGESGFTNGFWMLAAVTAVAALTALLIPALRTPVHLPEDEPEHPELALIPGGTVVGDKPE